MTRRIPWQLVAIGLLILVAGIAVGAVFIGAAQTSTEIIANIRAPRIALALCVGAGLALAGVLLQGVFQNPLADPAIIGVSTTAALGTTIAVILGLGFNTLGAAFGAMVGAAVALFIVVRTARHAGRTEIVTLLLAGVAVAAFAGAALAVLVSTGNTGRPLTFWLTGSLALATWAGVWTVLALLLIGVVLTALVGRPLDVLSLGDRAAAAAGVPVERVRIVAIAAIVFLVAPGVAVAGVIAFVGLVIPHAMRILVGPRHIPLLITSALAGALLILVADTAARTLVAPVEIPIGAITALIGAPVFFLLLRTTRRAQGGWG